MRYDAAIIGAGADGLAAAILLARAGRKVVVVERAQRPGGRCVTRPFHPGFSASPFCDTLPAMPAAIAGLIGLAAPGAPGHPSFLQSAAARQRQALLARILAEAARPAPRGLRAWLAALVPPPCPPRAEWPGTDWADRSAREVGASFLEARDARLKGSALALLEGPAMAPAAGGLGAFARRLTEKAWSAGVELRLGAEVHEIALEGGPALLLAEGGRIEARAVISTLDFKRSVMGLFRWSLLPESLLADAAAWRPAPPAARLLLALKAPPLPARPRLVAGDGDAPAAFRRGCIPLAPALRLDPVSRRDPGLVPPGGGVMTVTVPNIPFRLFDGPWSPAKRQFLAERVLLAVERAVPGTVAMLRAVETLVPPDFEAELGVSGGDLSGGEQAPDQMLGWRPGPRLDVPGFYLAGPSSAAGPLGSCAAGVAAAIAVLADGGKDFGP